MSWRDLQMGPFYCQIDLKNDSVTVSCNIFSFLPNPIENMEPQWTACSCVLRKGYDHLQNQQAEFEPLRLAAAALGQEGGAVGAVDPVGKNTCDWFYNVWQFGTKLAGDLETTEAWQSDCDQNCVAAVGRQLTAAPNIQKPGNVFPIRTSPIPSSFLNRTLETGPWVPVTKIISYTRWMFFLLKMSEMEQKWSCRFALKGLQDCSSSVFQNLFVSHRKQSDCRQPLPTLLLK